MDVIVIGAGIAGLTAACRLQANGYSVKVLEARERVGGRTYTTGLGDAVVDLGGQWVGPTQDRVYTLLRELGIVTYPQFAAGKNLLEMDGDLREYSGWLPRVPILHLLDLSLALYRLDRMARKLDLEAPAAHPQAPAWDSMSLADWMARKTRTSGARKLLEAATLGILACEPRDVSLLYFLYYLRSAGSLELLADVQGGAQQERIVGGAQQLSDGLAARLDNGVELEAPVVAIEQSAAGVEVHVRGSRGDAVHRARRVILAIPPALAARIDFRPGLPERRARLQTTMPMGSVIKCLIGYERPFWRDAGYTGHVISDHGPARVVFDACSADGKPFLVAFLSGDDARRMSALDVGERQRTVIAGLERFFGPEAAKVTAYADKDWIADPWSTGCYVGYMPPGAMSELGGALREPCGRLHFAGTETATRWIGYIDGAIESGERAADEVARELAGA